jgi:uncharacterized surface protein with fasciclin (FAS1) repeats
MRSPNSIWIIAALAVAGCGKKQAEDKQAEPTSAKSAEPTAVEPAGPAAPPPVDANNIVSIATGSKDHTTLVTALKAANYVTAVAGSGPLTVFAPTNAAFDKLPAGTLDTLTKPENADQLRNILKYHVTTSAWTSDKLTDGLDLAMSNGAHAIIHVKDGVITINDAKVLSSIPASNGVIHVIDTVLTPPAPGTPAPGAAPGTPAGTPPGTPPASPPGTPPATSPPGAPPAPSPQTTPSNR